MGGIIERRLRSERKEEIGEGRKWKIVWNVGGDRDKEKYSIRWC